jgi:hypothetical protein
VSLVSSLPLSGKADNLLISVYALSSLLPQLSAFCRHGTILIPSRYSRKWGGSFSGESTRLGGLVQAGIH